MRNSLTARQRDILVAAHLRADVSPQVIARELRVQERTVRYHLHSLISKGIIRYAPFLDVYPLGFRYYNVYFAHDALRPRELQRAIAELRASPRVSWIAEVGGEYHLALSIIARSPDECAETLEQLAASLPGLLMHKQVVVHRVLQVFSADYLAASKIRSTQTPLGYGLSAGPYATTSSYPIDELDHRILKAMSRKQLSSTRSIAQEVGRPHTTVALRLKSLAAAGVLSGFWYPIDTKKLGYQTLKLLVFCRGAPAEQAQKMRRYCRTHPHIVYCIECLGSWDFELGLDVRTDAGVSDMVSDLHERFAGWVHTIQVIPMFRVLKWSLYPFEERPA